jgi:DNA-binding SARP family transcriptional activator
VTSRSAFSVHVDLFGALRVRSGGSRPDFSPYQTALIAIVFAEGSVSRGRLGTLLWDREVDAPVRHRLRQLIHAIKTKTGLELFSTQGDELRPAPTVHSDVETLRQRLADGHLLEAAQIADRGLLGPTELDISNSFGDWREGFEQSLRRTLLRRTEGAWMSRSDARAWTKARDAAEAAYLLVPHDVDYIARVIEARARVGRLQAAEVAYTEHLQFRGRLGAAAAVEAAISRAREAESDAGRGPEPDLVPFVGRQSLLRELDTVVRDIRAGHCRFALIVGEAGIGKTRLIQEVSRSAALDGLRALESRPVELESRISLNPILDALSGVDLEAHLARLGEPWRTVIGATLPPDSLAEPVDEPPPIDAHGCLLHAARGDRSRETHHSVHR